MKAKLQWLKNGADVEEGQNVYLWENIDKSYEYVPKDGAVGLEAHQPYHKGSSITKGIYGNNGNGRETGSGGQGATIINGLRGSADSWQGVSTGGNSYSGGNGSGGLLITNAPAIGASATEATPKKGGSGYAYDPNNNISWFAGGGAGITGGNSGYRNKSSAYTDTKGEDGTGGLLMLYSDTLTNFGKISSEGSKGAGADSRTAFTTYWKGAAGGGGSGRRKHKHIYKRSYKCRRTISKRRSRWVCIRM